MTRVIPIGLLGLLIIWLPACPPSMVPQRDQREAEVFVKHDATAETGEGVIEEGTTCMDICVHLGTLSKVILSQESCIQRCKERSSRTRRECLFKAKNLDAVKRCAY